MQRFGVILLVLFGAIWWGVAVRASRHQEALFYSVGFLISIALVAMALRSRDRTQAPESPADRRQLVGIASGVEGALIFLAIGVLNNSGRSDFIAPVIAIIVGLHFLPLARWLPLPLYYGSAAALVTLGAIGFAVANAHSRLLLVAFGAASVLWSTAAAVLLARRTQRA